VIDNTPPEISSVFTGRTWIGLGDKFYVDAEVDDNSLHWERICKPIKCFVRVVDNKGKQGYLEGQLQMEEGVPKCSGFVTVNDTFYEAQAQLWVDAIDGAGNNASERKLEPIGIDNSKMISLTGVNESAWYKEDQWINNVVATVDSSKFGEVTSCSVDISGVSPENNLTHSGNQCIGSISIPHLSDGEKKLKVTATNINGKTVSDSVNIRIDNTPPEKIILSPINETYISTDIPIIINATDPLSGVKNVSFRVVKDAWLLFNLIPIPGTAYDSGWISTTFNGTTWNYTFNASDLTPGETYYFGSMVCDNAGNCIDPVSYTITIERPTTEQPSSTGSSSSGSSGSSGIVGGSLNGAANIDRGTPKVMTTNGVVQTSQITQPSKSCSPSWICGSWSLCVYGKQTRTCVDENNCAENSKKETQDCTSPSNTSPITGFLTLFNSLGVDAVIIASFVIFIIVTILKSRKYI
jgi:hypothetical protein